MKRLLFLSIVASVFATPVLAQDVVLDNFEGYADDVAFAAKWTGAAGFPSLTRATTGGANGTATHLDIYDGGFSMTAQGSQLAAPSAGNYTLSFYYQNGVQGMEAMSALTVELVQDATTRLTVSLGDAAAANWTLKTSTAAMFTASPVTVLVKAANGAAADHKALFDEFILTPVTNVPLNLTVFPDDRIYLSGTEKLVATPTFGSETYTKVEFDVNNDGTIEFTDTSAPFEFDWNTLDHVPAGTSRTLVTDPANTPIPVEITVTDNASNTKSIIEDYTVDNEFGGRDVLITNGDFSQWQGTGFGANLPVGWVVNFTTPVTDPKYGIGPGRDTAAGDALQITLTNPTQEPSPFPDRYVLRTNAHVGNYRDMQTTFWGKGTYSRLYYMTSTDGSTFASTLVDAGVADGSNWNLAVQTPVRNNLGLTDTTHVALGTHQLGTTDHFWDDISWEGNAITTSNVEGWNLY